jgi:uncharacterized protein (DUF924 family)
MALQRATEVLDFWFGTGPWTPERLAERTTFWFGGDGAEATAARDALIRGELEPLLERAAHGELANWGASPRQRLALILLFDQVPRNCYRGTAAAFAFDREALSLTLEGLQLGADAALDPLQRAFFYLPLEHAESREAQETSLAVFRRLATEAVAPLRDYCEGLLPYVQKHSDIVRRFGRFPHRNAVLDRPSTPEELQWLATGERFGQ